MQIQPGHRKRCNRWDEPWAAHFLTFSCYRRQPLFKGLNSPLWFIDALKSAKTKHPFELWAYVIMPEHVHLLICPRAGVLIKNILYAIKKPVTTWALRHIGQHAPQFLPKLLDRQPSGRESFRFWQRGGGYDRNMRSVPETFKKLNYIHNNPVTRGLVQRPEDWPWSSARAWATGCDDPIGIDRASMPDPPVT